jgi:GTP-binding protein HflX
MTEEIIRHYAGKYPVIDISAKNGSNLNALIDLISKVLPENMVTIEAVIPYGLEKLVSVIHERGTIISEEYLDEGTKIVAKIPNREKYLYEDYLLGGGDEKPNH